MPFSDGLSCPVYSRGQTPGAFGFIGTQYRAQVILRLPRDVSASYPGTAETYSGCFTRARYVEGRLFRGNSFFPQPFHLPRVAQRANDIRLIPELCQIVPDSVFAGLSSGDFLFVDSRTPSNWVQCHPHLSRHHSSPGARRIHSYPLPHGFAE
jgi:hypothetical protein